jgi:hypothetical protein
MWSGGSSDMKGFGVLVVLLALAIAACATSGSDARNSPTYREGFDDGCSTASMQGMPSQGRLVRDAALYDKDRDYRSGWTSGFASCRMAPPQIIGPTQR